MYSPSRAAPSPPCDPYLPPSHPFAGSYSPSTATANAANPWDSPRMTTLHHASSPPPPRRPGFSKHSSSPAAISTPQQQGLAGIAPDSTSSSACSIYSRADSETPLTPLSPRVQRVLDYRQPETKQATPRAHAHQPLGGPAWASSHRYDERSVSSAHSAAAASYSSKRTFQTVMSTLSQPSTYSASQSLSMSSRRQPRRSTSPSSAASVVSAMPNELHALDHRPRQNLLGDIEFIVGKKLRFPMLRSWSEGRKRRSEKKAQRQQDVKENGRAASLSISYPLERDEDDDQANANLLDARSARCKAGSPERLNDEEDEEPGVWEYVAPASRQASGRGARAGNWI